MNSTPTQNTTAPLVCDAKATGAVVNCKLQTPLSHVFINAIAFCLRMVPSAINLNSNSRA